MKEDRWKFRGVTPTQVSADWLSGMLPADWLRAFSSQVCRYLRRKHNDLWNAKVPDFRPEVKRYLEQGYVLGKAPQASPATPCGPRHKTHRSRSPCINANVPPLKAHLAPQGVVGCFDGGGVLEGPDLQPLPPRPQRRPPQLGTLTQKPPAPNPQEPLAY